MTKKASGKNPKVGEQTVGDLDETIVGDPARGDAGEDGDAHSSGEASGAAPAPAAAGEEMVEALLEHGCSVLVTKQSFGDGREYLVYDAVGHSYHHVATDAAGVWIYRRG